MASDRFDVPLREEALGLADLLLEVGAVHVRPEEPFRFRSGLSSPVYVDHRILLSRPSARKAFVDALTDRVRHVRDSLSPASAEGHLLTVAGVATGAIPYAAWVSDRLGLPMVYVRAERKEHGRGRRVEGELRAGTPVVLLEDLLTTGGTTLEAVDALENEGARVLSVFVLFTYGFPQGPARLAERGTAFSALTDFVALLRALERRGRTHEAEILRRWWEDVSRAGERDAE
ncbi:orotate phosphoribosyltransferase [Brockia lithotrophica]|uniref:Orotate phosphoribosyltransferase n=1 Tax=Brockia lithotrophica TaxID=933949 RepID=A0A660L3B8_9BACL|nr:orotate phosphoribosyltransferase [Brockia lithotrophica]RKQ88511.1 orotate phosphoribosyltransferase [Brockia lithotrophica]